MEKLKKYELDAVVETIIEQIKESKKNSPEQKEYQELVSTRNKVIEEVKEDRRLFNESQIEKYSKLYPKLEFNVDNYDELVNVLGLNKPEHYIATKTIERELIVSNIKGNVDETIKQIVEKYTK